MTTPKLHAHRAVLPGTDSPDCYSPPLGGEGKRPRRLTMRRPNLPIAVLIALTIPLAGMVAAASAAAAYNVSAVYKDCENNGQLTGHYSRAQLQAALSQLPTQVAEYSACADVIHQAIIRASSHGGGGHGGNGATTAGGGGGGGGNGRGGGSGHPGSGQNGTKAGTSSLKHGGSAGTGAGANAITLSGSNVRPGGTGSGSSSLPVALIVVLVLLALTAVSGGAVAIRRRVFARHST